MPPSSPGPGRPRDPELEQRVARAAMLVFGRMGWAGFTVDAVAAEAGVGKASIYLRWTNKLAVLDHAIRTLTVPVTDVDTGSLHGDLVELARQLLDIHLSDLGRAALRLGLETRTVPELSAHYDAAWRAQVTAARAMVRRGVARGDVAAGVSPTLVLDCLVGAVTNHVLTTPPELTVQVAASADRYAHDLVALLLRGSAPS